jgi:hypothetical protein
LELTADRETGAGKAEAHGCADALAHTIMLNMIGRQDTTTASVDRLRKEVAEANDSGMASVLSGLNARLRQYEQTEAQIEAEDPLKLLTARRCN